jgi:hypothetical protein
MRSLVRAGLIALAFCSAGVGHAQESIPPPLREWQDWVLHGEEFRRCPFMATAAPRATPRRPATIDARGRRNHAQRQCAWRQFPQRWQGSPKAG